MLVLLSVVVGWLAPARASAQASFAGEVRVLSVNALIGGVTSGVVAWLRQESFLPAFGCGTGGGGIQYLGKRLTTAVMPGAGLAGGVVGAVGASMVRNGAAGRGPLDRVVVPIGPVVLDWTTVKERRALHARLHLGRAIFLARLIANDDLRIDWGETLSAGSPVFQATDRVIDPEGGSGIRGVELWGAVSLSDRRLMPPFDFSRLLAHERVHLVQDDFLNVAWADPIEDWALAQVPYGDVVARYVDFGAAYMAIAGLFVAMLPYDARPWEDEAAYMEAGW